MQPGDIITFRKGGGSAYHHVGIYIGDGRMIHAPAPAATSNTPSSPATGRPKSGWLGESDEPGLRSRRSHADEHSRARRMFRPQTHARARTHGLKRTHRGPAELGAQDRAHRQGRYSGRRHPGPRHRRQRQPRRRGRGRTHRDVFHGHRDRPVPRRRRPSRDPVAVRDVRRRRAGRKP
ncbi:peptidoglycan endopeptidase (plasmid) [Xylanimonas allomyrinae]|uniref:Peptidoglycan endopeptidase n=1 Tax=Xylanimonas allomyrinae TaxID=2509459 RepID=A0A4P6EWM1_9MICO|nr:NlpC/P60 family protein [Xylanimonas allomyrinae]QAY64977.1 peptidoglycan endopeptidase [Xylanimonas allomyrinae]